MGVRDPMQTVGVNGEDGERMPAAVDPMSSRCLIESRYQMDPNEIAAKTTYEGIHSRPLVQHRRLATVLFAALHRDKRE